MKVFVISLKDAHERRAQAEAQLRTAGMPFAFFDAVTGDAGYARFFDGYDERRYLINTGHVAGSGEIGCFASHLALWKRCVALGEPILILEDDFELLLHFGDVFAETERLIDRFGFIRLQHEDRSRRRQVLRAGEFVLYHYTKMEKCLMCYAITPDAAERLIGESRILTAPADGFVARFWRHKQPLFGIAPYPVIPSDLARGSSMILAEREGVERDTRFKSERFLAKIGAAWSRLAFNLVNGRLADDPAIDAALNESKKRF